MLSDQGFLPSPLEILSSKQNMDVLIGISNQLLVKYVKLTTAKSEPTLR